MSRNTAKLTPDQLADTFFSVFYKAFATSSRVDSTTTIKHEGITVQLDVEARMLRVGNDAPQSLQDANEEMLRLQIERARDRAVKIARTPPPAPPREPRRIEMTKAPAPVASAPKKVTRSPESKQPTSIALLPDDKRALADLARREGLSQSEVVARAYKIYDRIVSRSPNARLLLEDPETKETVEIWIA